MQNFDLCGTFRRKMPFLIQKIPFFDKILNLHNSNRQKPCLCLELMENIRMINTRTTPDTSQWALNISVLHRNDKITEDLKI